MFKNCPLHRVFWVNHQSTDNQEESGTSRRDRGGVNAIRVIIQTPISLNRVIADKITVMLAYRAHRNRMRVKLRETSISAVHLQVEEIDTALVDAFEGSRREIVFFHAVATNQ